MLRIKQAFEAAAILDRDARRPERWIDADQHGLELAAESLVRARKAAGLTQKQLADRLGIPQPQVSRIERNPDATTVRTLKRVARALGVDIRAFLPRP